MSIAVVCMVNSTALAELDRVARIGKPVRNFSEEHQCSPKFSHKILVNHTILKRFKAA